MDKNKKQKRGSIRFLLVILALVGVAVLAVPFILIPPASLDIRLQDDAFGADLNGKLARVTDESGYTHEVPIYKSGGHFVAHVGRVYSGDSKWMVELDNYQSVHFTVDIKPLDKKSVSVKLKPTFGRLKIIARNAVKPDVPVHTSVTVTFGKQVFKGEADVGVDVFPMLPGKHAIKVEAPDYYTWSGSLPVTVGEEKEVLVYLAPRLKGDETARIVLRWDRDPRDLDAHLRLPRRAKPNHVYYPSKAKRATINNQLTAMLDVDDTTSFGPETITLYDKLDGTYTYAIYKYAGSGTLGSSEATVEVYTRDAEIRKFSVPEYCQKRWWHVFDLELNGTDVQVLERNQCKDKMNMMPGKKSEAAN